MDKNIKTITPPELPDVLDERARETKTTLNAVQIGTIQEFDKDTQRATIKIAMKQVKSISEDGIREISEYPLLLECPVMTLFGGVDILSMPIVKGDNCIILFNDRQIDEWLYGGDDQVPISPRTHDLSDGIAIVGIRPLTNSITNYLENGIRLSHGEGNSQIDLKDDLIDTIADLFVHNGNMRISGNLQVDGNMIGSGGIGGNIHLSSNLTQEAGKSISAGNGATGTFTIVNVENGIVTGGS